MDPCPIPELNFDAPNLGEAWRKWRTAMEFYLDTLPPRVNEKQRTAKFLLQIGERGREVFSTWRIPPENLTIECLLSKFEEHCSPKKNLVIERHRFMTMSQTDDETIDAFVTHLRKTAASCEFQQLEDDLILTKLIGGITSDPLRHRLLRESQSLTLTKALEMCRSEELMKMNIGLFKYSENEKSTPDETKDTAEVDAVSRNRGPRINQRNKAPCQRCGYNHGNANCPAMGRECKKCGKPNHFAKCCRTRGIQILEYDSHEDDAFEQQVGTLGGPNESAWFTKVNVNGQPVRFKLDTGAEVSLIPKHMLHKIHRGPIRPTKTRLTAFGGNVLMPLGKITARCSLKGRSVTLDFYVVDFATTPILGLNGCTKLELIDRVEEVQLCQEVQQEPQKGATRSQDLEEHEVTATHANRRQLRSPAKNKARFSRQERRDKLCEKKNQQTWNQIKAGRDPIDGMPLKSSKLEKNDESLNKCENKRNSVEEKTNPRYHGEKEFIETYADVFEGIGCFEQSCHIEVQAGARPVVHAKRKIPFSIQEKLKRKLKDMEKDGIIQKVEYPTEWVSSLMIVEKPDSSLRICLDPKELNEVIMRERHDIPTAEDIQRQLSGKKLFTVLDQTSGFWQVQLDDESTDLCTFNTPFGRYKFLRLPFGISCAPEIYQKLVEKTFGDISGTHVVFDDLIIAAETEEEHDRILNEVMLRAREKNVRFNKKKVQFKKKEVMYLGSLISQEGVKPDPDKVKAICEMSTPENKHDLKRFLGMVNFLASYIPDMSEKTAALRVLLKDDTLWTWDKPQEDAFEKLKSCLISAPVLKLYNSRQEVTLQVDASQNGLGAVLLQEGRPVAYASRALSEAETRYAQIEKELLAIVFGAEKFHQYIYMGEKQKYRQTTSL